MDKQRYEELISSHPLTFRHGLAIACNDGWFYLIDGIAAVVEHEILRLHAEGVGEERWPCPLQIKEKLGGLRFYISQATPLIADAIEAACREAERTCETCGAPGFLRAGPYLQVLCDPCCIATGRDCRPRAEGKAPIVEPPIRVFFDLEFTDLERGINAGIISLGLVTDSRLEFYAELAEGWSAADCSAFTREHVLPQLGIARPLTLAALRSELVEWFNRQMVYSSDSFLLVSDHRIDFDLLRARVLPDLEAWTEGRWRLRQGAHALVFRHQVIDSERVRALRQARKLPPHHALVDARALRVAVLEAEQQFGDDFGET